jgi:hypothetical protein
MTTPSGGTSIGPMKNILSSFILLAVLLSTPLSFAKSNIMGVVLTESGLLSVQIVDNPSEGPFTAGEIWQTIKADSVNSKGHRHLKTKNFEITCDAATTNPSHVFGTCKILVQLSNVIIHPSEVNFAISKDEAIAALNHFGQPLSSENILIKAPLNDIEYDKSSFMFEINWRHKMIAGVLDRRLVGE